VNRLRYVTLIASELDTERPGALPELFDSPDYKYFQDFKSRAMVIQAWSSYGVEWPVIYHFLGVRPNIPEREISVLPDLPPEWPTLSAQNIRVADSTMKASASQTLVCDCWRVQTG
jgi:glycogen debranching enzyme